MQIYRNELFLYIYIYVIYYHGLERFIYMRIIKFEGTKMWRTHVDPGFVN